MKNARKLLKKAEEANTAFNLSVKNMTDELRKSLSGVEISCSSMFNVRYFDLTTDHYKAGNFCQDFKIELKACDKVPETEKEMLEQMKIMAKEKILIKNAISFMNEFLKD